MRPADWIDDFATHQDTARPSPEIGDSSGSQQAQRPRRFRRRAPTREHQREDHHRRRDQLDAQHPAGGAGRDRRRQVARTSASCCSPTCPSPSTACSTTRRPRWRTPCSPPSRPRRSARLITLTPTTDDPYIAANVPADRLPADPRGHRRADLAGARFAATAPCRPGRPARPAVPQVRAGSPRFKAESGWRAVRR